MTPTTSSSVAVEAMRIAACDAKVTDCRGASRLDGAMANAPLGGGSRSVESSGPPGAAGSSSAERALRKAAFSAAAVSMSAATAAAAEPEAPLETGVA